MPEEERMLTHKEYCAIIQKGPTEELCWSRLLLVPNVAALEKELTDLKAKLDDAAKRIEWLEGQETRIRKAHYCRTCGKVHPCQTAALEQAQTFTPKCWDDCDEVNVMVSRPCSECPAWLSSRPDHKRDTPEAKR
jgi:hypothetical protein